MVPSTYHVCFLGQKYSQGGAPESRYTHSRVVNHFMRLSHVYEKWKSHGS